ncbi:MAG: porin family protein [Bacteroidaceae bacterium]|nr:porin family protein [Bacteroidaceae bacterium]
MKRIFLMLVTVCLFTAIPASAQFDFGIKAGMNFTEKPTNISGIKDTHTGWYAGPMLKYIFPVVGLGLEANALYSNSGTSIDQQTFEKNSFEIPLFLRYELRLPSIKEVFTPFIAAGPQWGYVFGEKELGNVKSWEDIKDFSDKYFRYKESYFSLNVGLGFILINHIQLHLNYNIPLGHTSEFYHKGDNLSDKVEYIKSKNNILQLSLAYIF